MNGLIRRGGSLRSVGLGSPSAALGVVLLALLAVGCGNDGTITVQQTKGEPANAGAISGTVFAPNGQIARAERWWNWVPALDLVPKAYAALNPNVEPVAQAVVSISAIDESDAADGKIDSPRFISQALTSLEGKYTIVHPDLRDLDQPRLLAAVGGGELLTRGFVLSSLTDVDVASETTVRVVLDRIGQGSPPVQLGDFTTAALANLLDVVANATFTATGDSVFEINRNAYQMATHDICVKDAIDKATNDDTDGTPSACLRFYP
jgi:hypothetical protein